MLLQLLLLVLPGWLERVCLRQRQDLLPLAGAHSSKKAR